MSIFELRRAYHNSLRNMRGWLGDDALSGRLTVINRQPSEGIDPCHLTIDAKGRHVLVANYTSGSVAVLPLAADGRLERASSIPRRTG